MVILYEFDIGPRLLVYAISDARMVGLRDNPGKLGTFMSARMNLKLCNSLLRDFYMVGRKYAIKG